MHAADITRYVSPENCVTLLDVMGSDARVVNAARVSFAKWIDEKQPLALKDSNLIGYLAKHEHSSPFFHPQVCFRLKMPIFVAREWFRHVVGFSRNETSRRYVDGPVECFLPLVARARDNAVKQGSMQTPVFLNEQCLISMRESYDRCMQTYRELLLHNVAPEVARMVLPQSMFTEFVETGSLMAYARLCKQRCAPDAQYEIRQYADAVDKLLMSKFPVCWAALKSA